MIPLRVLPEELFSSSDVTDSLLSAATLFNSPMTGISLNQPLADIAWVQLNHCNLDKRNHYLHKFHFMPDSLREGKQTKLHQCQASWSSYVIWWHMKADSQLWVWRYPGFSYPHVSQIRFHFWKHQEESWSFFASNRRRDKRLWMYLPICVGGGNKLGRGKVIRYGLIDLGRRDTPHSAGRAPLILRNCWRCMNSDKIPH